MCAVCVSHTLNSVLFSTLSLSLSHFVCVCVCVCTTNNLSNSFELIQFCWGGSPVMLVARQQNSPHFAGNPKCVQNVLNNVT